MRILIAAAMATLAIAAFFLGIGQRLFWAPPPTVSLSVKYNPTAPFTVIPHELLIAHAGNPTVKVNSDRPGIFIASGREADILAFVGDSPSTQLAVNPKKTGIDAKKIFGNDAGFSPAGLDIWRAETSGVQRAALELKIAADGAALVASNGFKNAPGEIQLTWPIFHDLTWSNVFLISGGLLFLAAIVLLILHFIERRRKLGPRIRLPKAPSGPKYKVKRKIQFAPMKGRRSSGRALRTGFMAFATVAILSGCGVATPATPATPKSNSSALISTAAVAPPVVVASQLRRILAEVAVAAKQADEANDKKFLSPRFVGPALSLRSVHYYLRSVNKKIVALPAIVDKPLSFSLPSASSTWPRSIMAVTDEPGDVVLPQLIVMQQKSPRENYQVWYVVRLMPGAKIPAVPAAGTGAIPVAAKSLFLKVPPLSLPATYGDLVNKGQSSLSAQLFDVTNDEFYKQVSSSQIQQVKNLKNGKITFTHKLGEANVIGLSTSQAGALVAVYMTDTYLIKPTKVGTAVGVSGQEALILGANGSTRGVRSIYGNMLLFFVPALSETARIRLIGVTQGLVSVRGL